MAQEQQIVWRKNKLRRTKKNIIFVPFFLVENCAQFRLARIFLHPQFLPDCH
jgi:hypothetical protein